MQQLRKEGKSHRVIGKEASSNKTRVYNGGRKSRGYAVAAVSADAFQLKPLFADRRGVYSLTRRNPSALSFARLTTTIWMRGQTDNGREVVVWLKPAR